LRPFAAAAWRHGRPISDVHPGTREGSETRSVRVNEKDDFQDRPWHAEGIVYDRAYIRTNMRVHGDSTNGDLGEIPALERLEGAEPSERNSHLW